MSDETAYAWAAGVLEGEGCFSLHQRANRRSTKSAAIHCEMTDEDIVRRVQAVFGVGTVNLRLNKNNRRQDSVRKPTWVWSVQNKAGVLEVILRVLPYLGERRCSKAKELLTHIEEVGYED